ncbi:MAG: DUF4845 domain-containing protein [Acidobacteria bacterium]|nr:DUF4845 domain-containing protein [Acidobacteriota bacterium]
MRDEQGSGAGGVEQPRRLSRWRIVAGAAVLAGLAFIAMRLAPIYVDNFELQRYVAEITQRADIDTRSDDLLRTWVMEKAAKLELPVKAQDVQVRRSSQGTRIDVRYVVRVDLPVYTVDLHFYPGAGAR